MRRSLLAPALVALALGGCGGGDDGPSVVVEPPSSRVDEPIRIAVRGLEPRQSVTLRLRSTDAAGVRWASSATVLAGRDGAVDVRELGLLTSMQPATAPANGRYQWEEQRASTFVVDVLAGGEAVASASFGRTFPTSRYTIQPASVADTGFAGVYLAPTGAGRRPPVLVLGGGGGGLPLPVDIFLVAARGYPVLALAYFGEEGVPGQLSRIPLEYFARALRWLDGKPHADGRGVVVWGISRGSEAALLLGVHYPRLVRGVVALVPSNVSHCGDPCTGPAWTIRGKEVPFTRQFDEARPTDDPRAVIPVERIRGDVLAVCGGKDSTWASCAHSTAIVERGDATLLSYPGAGHGLGTLAPYHPSIGDDPTHVADQSARADAWPRVLDFLESA